MPEGCLAFDINSPSLFLNLLGEFFKLKIMKKTILNVLLIIVISGIFSSLIAVIWILYWEKQPPKKYSYPHDCLIEAEMHYTEAKINLTKEVQYYIDSIAPLSNLRAYALIDECEKYNVDVCFVLAQGELESHFGTKGLGAKFNNIFNVAVYDSVKSKKDMHKGYIYTYPNESIEPYLQLLTNNYLINKHESDLLVNFVNIKGQRYASDENYEFKLSDKYNKIIKTTNIKQLQAVKRHYAIKTGRKWQK